jgi:hypothetical protein
MLCPPNLPTGRVDRLLLGAKYYRFERALAAFGTQVIYLSDIPEVDPRLSGHVDLAALAIGGKLLLGGAAGAELERDMCALGWETQLVPIEGSVFPKDASLNACVIGEFVLHNREISAIPFCEKFINIKQGYARCAVCVVDEHSIITADAGIARACEAAGLDVLRISAGYVELPGYSYGFIGGASFKLAPDVMAFTGDIRSHPDADAILQFLHNRGVEAFCLGGGALLDTGSAVPLTQI